MENENQKTNRYARRHPAAFARAVAAGIANGFADVVAVTLRSPLVVSPMAFAVDFDDVDWECANHAQVQKMIGRGADVHKTDKDGNTVLHCAAYFGNDKVIPTLIQAGADVHAKNNDGKTPLDLAKEEKKWNAAKALEDAGAK